MKNEEEKTNNEQITDDLDGDIIHPDEQEQPQASTWDNEQVEDDVYSGRDREQLKEIYVLTIPNKKKLKSGEDNPGYGLLCLDKELTIPPAETIPCVVLKRIRPNIESVPFNESEGLKPWEKTLGYSLDGIKPTPNALGEYFQSCVNPQTGKPFACCSRPTEYEDGKQQVLPLDAERQALITKKDFPYLSKDMKIETEGECWRGRWANTLPESDRKKWGITSQKAKPRCDEHVIIFAWHLTQELLFAGYFKRASLAGANNFLSGFKRTTGPNAKSIPLYTREALISIRHHETYSIPVITNTGKEANYSKIKPVVDWFRGREGDFVRNLSLVLTELREQEAQKKEDA